MGSGRSVHPYPPLTTARGYALRPDLRVAVFLTVVSFAAVFFAVVVFCAEVLVLPVVFFLGISWTSASVPVPSPRETFALSTDFRKAAIKSSTLPAGFSGSGTWGSSRSSRFASITFDLPHPFDQDLLLQLWPVLRTLVGCSVRTVWEDAFPALASRARAAA